MSESFRLKKRLINAIGTIYLIRYTLHDEKGRHVDYRKMIETISEKYPCCWHCLFSTWVIKTVDSESRILSKLAKHLDKNDAIIITKLNEGFIFKGKFDDKLPDCLKSDISIQT